MSIVASIEARIKEYEAAVANSLANHNGLLGALNELKNLLHLSSSVAEAVAPESEVAQALEVAEQVVDAVAPAPVEHE